MLVPVSQLLGVGFKPRFLSRYCIPLFGNPAAASGFDSAPGSQHVPSTSVLRTAPENGLPEDLDETAEFSDGRYRLKYILAPQVAAHPDAFVRPITHDGPYPIRNMWTDRVFYHSIL